MLMNLSWIDWRTLRSMLTQAFMVVGILIGILFLLVALNRAYGNYPPVSMVSLDPLDLGEVCSWQEIPFHNQVHIASITTVVYDFSTMDEFRHFNYLGTSGRFQGLPHPVANITFEQEIAWRVPNLPPGRYARVLGARGHDTDEKPVFIWSHFTIKPWEECK